jgi:hypothetical protein
MAGREHESPAREANDAHRESMSRLVEQQSKTVKALNIEAVRG